MSITYTILHVSYTYACIITRTVVCIDIYVTTYHITYYMYTIQHIPCIHV